MKQTVTLTPGHAIDVFPAAEATAPTRKSRTSDERIAPGNGIGIARIVRDIGDAPAVRPSGGETGKVPGAPIEDAVRLGSPAGGAAVTRAGTAVCGPADVPERHRHASVATEARGLPTAAAV